MDKAHINFKLKRISFVIGICLSILAAVAYSYFMEWNVVLDDWLKIMGTGVAITSVLYASMTLESLNVSQQQSNKLKKQEYSADLIRNWISPSQRESMLLSKQFRVVTKDMTPKEISAYIEDNHDIHLAIMTERNYLEHMAQTINCGLADESLLKDFFFSIVKTRHGMLKEFIHVTRKRYLSETIFSAFEQLAVRWQRM